MPRGQTFNVIYNAIPNPIYISNDANDSIEDYLHWRRTSMNHVPRGSYDWPAPEPILSKPHIILMCYNTEKEDTAFVERVINKYIFFVYVV